MKAISLVMLGIVLFLAGCAVNWVQDAVAPWVNLGEAQMGSPLRFEAGDGRYRVISSGPSRPPIDRTVCTARFADGSTKRMLGGSGAVNAREALGVSRVLEFRAQPGSMWLLCEHRILRDSRWGRFQVVSASGPVSKAVLAMFALSGLSLLSGGLWLTLQVRRARRAAA